LREAKAGDRIAPAFLEAMPLVCAPAELSRRVGALPLTSDYFRDNCLQVGFELIDLRL
jgi:hypothetical protein